MRESRNSTGLRLPTQQLDRLAIGNERNHTSFHVHADISDVFVDIGDLHAVYHKRSWLNEDCFSRSQNFRGVFAKLCGQVD
jgi:hypothetical protein